MDSSRNYRRGGMDWRPFILSGLHGINPHTTHQALNFDPSSDTYRGWSSLTREEADLETQIILLISSGDWDSLNPNSGQSVEVGNHNVCVAYQEDAHSGYRTWEWHGHMLMYDGRGGYTTEYFYGNYPQPMEKKDKADVPNVVNGGGPGGIVDGEQDRVRNVNKDESASRPTSRKQRLSRMK